MKKLLLGSSFLALSMFFYGCENNQETENTTTETVETEEADTTAQQLTYSIDTTQSNIEWEGAKATGDKHIGILKLEGGQLVAQGDQINSGEIVIDMQSIENKDIEDPEKKQKLENHLKADDFFAAGKYPTATFKVTGTGTNEEGKKVIIGDLSIRDSIQQIQVPVDLNIEENQLKAEGSTTFDRSKFNVRYGSGSFFEDLGDKLIEDEIKIKFNIVATPEQEM